MAILTSEQKAAYMRDGWAKCPFCQSEDVSGGQLQVEANEAWQYVTCGECGEGWTDVYKLAFVETDEELSKGPVEVQP